MAEPARKPTSQPWTLDPKRSLVAGTMWLIIALVLAFTLVAAVWVGSIARDTVFQQHVRRLRLETDQLSAELGVALADRMDAVRAVAALLRTPRTDFTAAELGELFTALTVAYPQLDWLAIADPGGRIVAANAAPPMGTDVSAAPWFRAGADGPWLGVVAAPPVPAGRTATGSTPRGPDPAASTVLGDLALPVHDPAGRRVGVILTRASWRRTMPHFPRLTDETDPQLATTPLVLDRDGQVLIGPDALRGQPWPGVAQVAARGDPPDTPRFEHLPDGQQLLVSRAPLAGDAAIAALGWQVQLDEPNAHVFQRADAVALRILWISLALGAVTAVLGVLAARRLTARLQRLTESVELLGQSETATLEVPTGVDEAARLGAAFARLLGALQEERRELERRVAVRTREVERLAEESRYAAIVRERLKIARDLHDTLAHSMMAMLSEIRLLRRLQARDPSALAEELRHAEEVAHAGLGEARRAITQMRSNTVRETGLGPALADELKHFINRTGLTAELLAEPEAARFGDERAEAILRIAQEALRNVERHAQATRVQVRLQVARGTHLVLGIADDGIGFDIAQVPAGHYGLIGLREQAELMGGTLQIDSGSDRGTTITLEVPLSPVAFAAQ